MHWINGQYQLSFLTAFSAYNFILTDHFPSERLIFLNSNVAPTIDSIDPFILNLIEWNGEKNNEQKMRKEKTCFKQIRIAFYACRDIISIFGWHKYSFFVSISFYYEYLWAQNKWNHFDLNLFPWPLDIVKNNKQRIKNRLDTKKTYTHILINKPTHNLVMSKSCDLPKKKKPIDYMLLWPIILNNIEIAIIHTSLSLSLFPVQIM